MQNHAISCNTMQYHAIPCMLNNCWRSVPLPCGQYMAIFSVIWFKLDKSETYSVGCFCWPPWTAAGWRRVETKSVVNSGDRWGQGTGAGGGISGGCHKIWVEMDGGWNGEVQKSWHWQVVWIDDLITNSGFCWKVFQIKRQITTSQCWSRTTTKIDFRIHFVFFVC